LCGKLALKASTQQIEGGESDERVQRDDGPRKRSLHVAWRLTVNQTQKCRVISNHTDSRFAGSLILKVNQVTLHPQGILHHFHVPIGATLMG